MKNPRALLLFSEGLDSILSGKVLQAQGIEVVALRFITPFFGWQWKNREAEFEALVQEKYGFSGAVVDITAAFLEILVAPKHGYGSGFNPCVDCRILMLQQAKNLLSVYGADFLATGEVVGQRPMTQQRPILRHIEKEAGVVGQVLRPLCAQILWETEPERQGLVNRKELFAFTGRGRKRQLTLARTLGLKEIPSPAGGCLLTDPNLAPRFREFCHWKKPGKLTPREAELLTFGRHFPLGQSWLVLGRVAEENQRLLALAKEHEAILRLRKIPGPTGLLLGNPRREELFKAAALLARYAPKARKISAVKVSVTLKGQQESILLDESVKAAK